MANSGHPGESGSPAEEGEYRAVDDLFAVVYEQLRSLAKVQMRSERPDRTLQTIALIHEAYLRLAEQDGARWQNRSQFLAVAAEAMRRILIDSVRRHRRAKRGGDRSKVPLHEGVAIAEARDVDLIALDDALTELATISRDAALRQEVESLLAVEADVGGFLEPIRPAPTRTRTAAGPVPQRISHYRIERRLGAGGMGFVYQAYNIALGRPAAIKLLPEVSRPRWRLGWSAKPRLTRVSNTRVLRLSTKRASRKV